MNLKLRHRVCVKTVSFCVSFCVRVTYISKRIVPAVIHAETADLKVPVHLPPLPLLKLVGTGAWITGLHSALKVLIGLSLGVGAVHYCALVYF